MNSLTEALILVEDRRFRTHWGIDPLSIARAFLTNVTEKRYSQGGSTITQQLARTLYLHNRKTIFRKIVEVFIAFYLELTMTKDEILDSYMHLVYMGQTVRSKSIKGFHTASQYYFHRQMKDLSLAQQAALVAMLKGPNIYSPSSQKGTARRILVLAKMLDSGIINRDEFFQASKVKL